MKEVSFLGTSGSYFTPSMNLMVFEFYEDAFYHQIYSGNGMQLYSVRLVCDYVAPTPPTDIEEVTGDRLQVAGCRKVMRDGQLIIIREGEMFNALGVKL